MLEPRQQQPDAKHMHITVNSHNYGCIGFGNTNQVAMSLQTPQFHQQDYESGRLNTAETPAHHAQQLFPFREDSPSKLNQGLYNRPRTRTEMSSANPISAS